jgi:hypothetical protein
MIRSVEIFESQIAAKIQPESFMDSCNQQDEDCPDYEDGVYSDGSPRKYEICQAITPECGIYPFLNRQN